MVKKLYTKDNQAHWVADETEELKSMKKVNFGDMCYVIHTKMTYILDSEKWWYPFDMDGDPVPCNCVSESTIWGVLPED